MHTGCILQRLVETRVQGTGRVMVWWRMSITCILNDAGVLLIHVDENAYRRTVTKRAGEVDWRVQSS